MVEPLRDVRAFFPAWAARFEFTAIDWLDKELFLAPPQGEKQQLDLVARLRLRPALRRPMAECLEAQADLDEGQKERLQELLTTERYQEVKPIMIITPAAKRITSPTRQRGNLLAGASGLCEDLPCRRNTTYERGILQGKRRSTLRQLEAKFGPPPPEVRQRVEALSPEELAQLQLDLLKAQSLKELRLDD